MKLDICFPPGFRVRGRLLAGALSILAFASSANAQTGIYTLDGGVATQSGQTYAAIEADQSGVFVFNSGELTLSSPTITKTGDASSIANSSERGVNAGVLASSAGIVTIFGGSVTTNAIDANGLFATAFGSTVRMSDGTVATTGTTSAGVDVSFGGMAILSAVHVTTQQTDSPALAMSYGGGTITVNGGTFLTAGSMSPAIYCLGTVSATSAVLTARAGPGAIIDGANTISLTNCALTGLLDGADLEETAPGTGSAAFSADGGSITSLAGDLFFLASENGPLTAAITLTGGATVSTGTGYLVDATSNSRANFVADGETLGGNLITDASSTIAAVLQNGTTLTGHINPAGLGTDNLTIDATSTWLVNGSSILSSVTNAGSLAFDEDGLSVTVSGAYSQAGSGKLLVVLGGAAAGTNYDRLDVTGEATLAGTLEVNDAGGFIPQVGEKFIIATYGRQAGSFATLTSSSGLTYTANYGAQAATITITSTPADSGAPMITTQPASVVADPGASAVFSVAAAGIATLSYQWYEDGRVIHGATSASYTIERVTDSDTGRYDVVVRNSLGSVTSSSATLKVKVTTQPVPIITIAVLGDGEIVQGGEKGKTLISRTGNTKAELKVYYQLKGNAVNGSDYVGTNGAALSGKVVIPAGEASVELKIEATPGVKASPIEKVNVVLVASPVADYAVGTAYKAKLQLVSKK
jgi:hypothetical protein